MIINTAVHNSHFNEYEILDFMSNLLSLKSLDNVLHSIVQKTPRLINNKGCSIYLSPRFVRRYNGKLIESEDKDTGEINKINAKEIKGKFIVLAASSRDRNIENRIGKYFYRSGEGLTGWVMKYRKEIFLDNLNNPIEINSKYKNVTWLNKYRGAEHHYGDDVTIIKPFLAVPIMVENNCEGVIRVSSPVDGGSFPFWAQKTFHSFGHVISKRLEIESIIYTQQGTMGRLIKKFNRFGNRAERKVFNAIVKEAKNLIGGSVCDLFYLIDRNGMTIEGVATTDPIINKRQRNFHEVEKIKQLLPGPFKRECDSLTGWVFKNAKHLMLPNVRSFENGRTLKNQELCVFSNAAGIGKDGAFIKVKPEEVRDFKYTRFLGLPIKSASGKVLGVINILATKKARPFSEHQLQLLNGFCETVSILLANQKRKKLTDVLLRIGQEHGDKLFQYVVDTIPELILAPSCSIFVAEADHFKLKYTSSPKLIYNNEPKRLKEIIYEPGNGKTGFVGGIGKTFVINHYGEGNFEQKDLHLDYEKYLNDQEYRNLNLINCVKNGKGENAVDVGIARLIRQPDDKDFTTEEQLRFTELIENTYFTDKGLLSQKKQDKCEVFFAWSYLACPLKDTEGNVYGVLRIPRGFPGGIFTDEDVSLTMAVANRLCSILEKERILEKNVRFLGKITNQINASFDKDRDAVLQSILEAVTDTLEFEFATIQLVNKDKTDIVTELTKKNYAAPDNAWDPKDLKGNSNPLDPQGKIRDIHAWLLREHRKAVIYPGRNIHLNEEIYKHLDQKIYTEYHHERLIRAFIPILGQNPDGDIGTLETGNDISRNDSIDNYKLVMLEALAEQTAVVIRNHDLKQKVLQAARLELISTKMHLLKSPAGSIKMLLDAMAQELEKPMPDMQRLQEYVSEAKPPADIITLRSLTSSVDNESELHSLHCNPTDLIEFINKRINEFCSYKPIKLKNALLERITLPLNSLECNWLQIIIWNLFLNSVQYSPPNGSILVNIGKEKERFVISIIDEGGSLLIFYLTIYINLGQAKKWGLGHMALD
jgi:GAF domain-containing protein